MENIIHALNSPSIVTNSAYFVAGTVIAVCAYKISQYVFPNNKDSQIKLFFSILAIDWSIAAKVALNVDSTQSQIIPVLSCVCGTIVVAFVVVIWLFKNKRNENIKTINNHKSLREVDYESIWPQLANKNIIYLLGPPGVDKLDFIGSYLSKESRPVYVLPRQFNGFAAFRNNWDSIRSLCQRHGAVLFISDPYWLLDPQNNLEFCDFLYTYGGDTKIIITIEDISLEEFPGNLTSKIAAVPISPASKEVSIKILKQKYTGLDVDVDDEITLEDIADFLPGALPGSLLELYDQFLKQTQETFLKEFVRKVVNIDPFWLEKWEPKELIAAMDKAKINISKELSGVEEIITQINALMIQGIQAKGDPDKNAALANILLAGPSGSGKTAIAKAIAKHFFKDRLVVINLSILSGNNHSVLHKNIAYLKENPNSVILIEEIDRFATRPDNSSRAFDLASLQFLTDILRGDFKEIKLPKALIIMTAKDEGKIDSALKENIAVVPVLYKENFFDQFFTLLFDRTLADCKKWGSIENKPDIQKLKKLCPPFEGSITNIQKFFERQMMVPFIEEQMSNPSQKWVSFPSRVTESLILRTSLSQSAAQFVNVIPLLADSNEFHGVNRDIETQQLFNAINHKQGAIIVGPGASGKSDLIGWLTQMKLKQREVIRLNTMNFEANTQFVGTFQARVSELKERVMRNNSLLVIEDASILLTKKLTSDYFKFGDLLEKIIEEGGFSTIIALTSDEYKELELYQPKLLTLLTKIELLPLKPKESLTVLQKIQPQMEKKLKCTFDPKAFDVLLQYSHYLKGSLPGSAILFLESMPLQENERVSAEKILNSFALRLNIGLEWLQIGHPGLAPKIAEAKISLKKSIHGQDESIDQICDLIEVRHKKLSPSLTTTLGNFLVMGDPGVGKTFFAQLLSKQLFHSNFIRIDMQHLIDINELVKLTAHGGALSRLNDHPFSVVLLDEIEKAPREAQDALLGILQDGRFVDKNGHEVRFDHAVIIMTTNASQQNLDRHFTTAFISRTTSVAFNPLSEEALTSIIKDKLEVIKKSCEAYQTVIEFPEVVITFLVKKFLSEKRNARDADRFLEEKISRPLAKVQKSDQKLTAKISSDNIIFELAQ